jgi:hypothetical protein
MLAQLLAHAGATPELDAARRVGETEVKPDRRKPSVLGHGAHPA